MPRCKNIQRPHRKLCLGDLDTLITITDRSITAPNQGQEYGIDFPDPIQAWAAIFTKTGVTVFDEVNGERNVSHQIYVQFEIDVTDSITAENWIEFEGNRYDILSVEDLEERHEWLFLSCALSGSDTKEATKA